MGNKKVNKSSVFPKRLKTLMEQKRLTQQKVAEMTGVSQPTVGKWLKGTLPNGVNFSNLASANGVSVDWFFAGGINFGGMERGETSEILAGESPQKKPVDILTHSKHIEGVKPILPGILERLKKATSERGMKTKLAKFLKDALGREVQLVNVSQWLSGKRMPDGETTLQMLQWVEAQERK